MSGGTTAIMAAAAVASTAYSVYSGQQQQAAQKKAAGQAEKNAQDTAARADQEINRKNAKTPNTMALLSDNQQAAQAGESGTMLTGPSGVDPSTLALGKNTLLGQ